MWGFDRNNLLQVDWVDPRCYTAVHRRKSLNLFFFESDFETRKALLPQPNSNSNAFPLQIVPGQVARICEKVSTQKNDCQERVKGLRRGLVTGWAGMSPTRFWGFFFGSISLRDDGACGGKGRWVGQEVKRILNIGKVEDDR